MQSRMKVYLAGLNHGHLKFSSKSENVALMRDTARAYPYHLESYHYIKSDADARETYLGIGADVFLDSGAFTAFMQGTEISLPDYAEYIKSNREWLTVISNLDAIGKGNEQLSYDNQKELERLGAVTTPVHHARDDDRWLGKYIAEGYDYIALGGMVAESKRYLTEWLDHVWNRYLTRADGSARVKVHGFGLTTIDLMERYPWYSVDSTRWMWVGRYGMVFIDMPDGRDIMLHISSQSPRLHTLDAHYDTLSAPNKKMVQEQMLRMGYDPEQLRLMHGLRDKWNIEFFHRLCDRPAHPFKKRQISLLD